MKIRNVLLWMGLMMGLAGATAGAQTRTPPQADASRTKPRLVAQLGHSRQVNVVALSPDGKLALTGSEDGTAILWDVATGLQLQTLACDTRRREHAKEVTSVAFSPNSKQALTGITDGTAILWDLATGRQLRTLRHSEKVNKVNYVAYSPDGKRAITGGDDGTAILWNLATGQPLQTLRAHPRVVSSMAYSPDGKQAITGGGDDIAILWDLTTGQPRRTLKGRYVYSQRVVDEVFVDEVAFSPDGKRALTGSDHSTAILWDLATGRQLSMLKGHQNSIHSMAFSPNGKEAITGGGDDIAILWDLTTGQPLRTLKGHENSATSVAFSPDAKQALTGSYDGTTIVWDLATGQPLRTLKGHAKPVHYVAFSSDGKQALTGFSEHPLAGAYISIGDDTVIPWDLVTGQPLRTLQRYSKVENAVAFSPDGKQALTVSRESEYAILWDIATGQSVRTLRHGDDVEVESVAFSPDNKQALTGGDDGAAILWDLATGHQLRTLKGHLDAITTVAFSSDGKRALIGSGKTVILWDLATGESLHTLEGKSNGITSVAFSPDGKQALTGSDDGTAILWSMETGQELCRLIRFDDGTWAVVDPSGRYDASNEGDVEGLQLVVGNEPIALKQLKQRYYDPGLLAKYLGYNKEPLRDVTPFDHVALWPEVRSATIPNGGTKLTFTLVNRGGGIGKVAISVNGKEIQADARGPHADPNASHATLTVNLAHAPTLVPGRDNPVKIVAYNAEGDLASRGTELAYTPPGASTTTRPELYAIVAGAADYAAPQLHLRFAAKDAEDFAHALQLGANKLFGVAQTHIALLTTDGGSGAMAPTKANLRQAFLDARLARPGDIFVVYLAGHGVAVRDTYCYLTSDARTADLSDRAVREQTSVTSEELATWIEQIPAHKQAMVLDTCAAGAAAARLAEKRDIPGDQVRAINRLKDRTGFFVLMGCASDAVSYEATRYGQGLLTYALLQGMRGAKLRAGEYVDISPLMEYAADTVQDLARDVGGIQRPQIIAPRSGTSFDVGLMTAAERSAIPLAQPHPLLLRPQFLNGDAGFDDLNLTALLDRRLREGSPAGARGGAPIYVDAEEMPGALRASGTYVVAGAKVTVRLVLSQDGKKVTALQVEGAKDDAEGLAAKLEAAIEGAVHFPPPDPF